jgi:hypothetical protein
MNNVFNNKILKGRLKWDPIDYSNISLLRISSDQIWTYAYINNLLIKML